MEDKEDKVIKLSPKSEGLLGLTACEKAFLL